MSISPIQEVIQDFKAGKFVVMVDHRDRENEGDLMLGAQFSNAANINFMIQKARGLICLAMTPQQIYQLKLPLMKSPQHSSHSNHAAFTYTIEAKNGIKTGISARERAHTIQTAINKNSTAVDIVCPGHVFPLLAKDGGVLIRPGHTEAAVDLALLAELNPATVLCEILDDNGEAAGREFLESFSKLHEIKIGAIEDLIAYRKELQGRHER